MRYLIVKTSAFGDIIHAFPVLNYLKKRFPSATVDWAAESPFVEALEAHPLVNKVYRLKSKEWRKGRDLKGLFAFRKQLKEFSYDAVFDLQGNCKSALATFWARSKSKVGFGRKTVAEWPNLLVTRSRFNPSQSNVRENYLGLVRAYFQDDEQEVFKEKILLRIKPEESDWVQTFLEPFNGKKKILVCPGSAWPNKQMTTEALVFFLDRVQRLQESNFFILWGNEKEREMAQSIQAGLPNAVVMDRLSIPLLQNLMEEMDLVISMDSLPLHLAATTSTPTFSIFGASSGNKYAPSGKEHIFYQGECPYGRTFEKRCPILRSCSSGACIRSLTGDEVFQQFSDSIKSI